MLRTIIIDDETIIREGLKQTINWENMGYEIVGEAKDGEEAIQLLQSTMPDVIITDIRMPFIDGLELIEFIKPMLPDAFIIILSGHDEFHYAQKALQLGVYDFLLKPLKIDYFEKLLKKIKYDYTVKKNNASKPLLEEDLRHLKIRYIDALIHNTYKKENFTRKLENYQLDEIKDFYFCNIIVQIDNFQLSVADVTFDQINEIHREYFRLINDTVQANNYRFIVEGNTGDAAIIVCSESSNELEMKRDMIVNQVRSNLEHQTPHSITIATSSIKKGIISLPEIYEQAYETSNQRFVSGYNQNFAYTSSDSDSTNNNQNSSYPQIGFDQKKYIQLIKNDDITKVKTYIEEIFRNIVQHGHNSTLYVTMFVTSLYVEILNMLNQKGLSIGDIYDDPLTLYKNMTISTNIYDTKSIILDLSLKTSEYLNSHNSPSINIRITEAKDYISENFNSHDLTLQEVAQKVNMGICYFSTMFKKETGESFINYLTRIRINKAKELFENTHYKAYEVSYMVGYNTPTYFSSLFKKVTGKSPSDYRNQ